MSLNTPKLGWARALLIIIPYILFIGVFELLGMFLAGVSPFDLQALAHLTPYQTAFSHLFKCAGTLLFLWGVMNILDKKPFLTLGFYLKKRRKDIFIGILLGFLIMAIGYKILSLTNELSFKRFNFNLMDCFWTVLLFACVAITEETLVRGYILRNFMQSMNKYLALILSAILFAALHGFNPNMSYFSFLSLFLAGILLGITYIYTQNLWFPIALHFSWNFFQSLFGFNVSGQDMYSLIEFSIPSANYFNGAAFGFEGSYLSLIADIFVIVGAVWIYATKKPADHP